MKWDGLAQVLTQLQHREFWCRQRGNFTPTKHKTFDMFDPRMSTQIREKRKALIEYSGQQFGRLKSDIKRELDQRYQYRPKSDSENRNGSERDADSHDENMWGF